MGARASPVWTEHLDGPGQRLAQQYRRTSADSLVFPVRGRPVLDPLAPRVASRFLIAEGYFRVGDLVLFGKYKNKRGKVISFGSDKWGNPTVEIEPVPKGRKENKVFGLYRIWRADVKEKALAEQAKDVDPEPVDPMDPNDDHDHDFES
jgi:hypothetical protein